MTREEYASYCESVAAFFEREGIENLSTKADCGESFFSWRPCDCCGTHLGGDRYECNGYNRGTGEVLDYDSVCSDCVYFAEYGELDDMTMMSIEGEK